MWVADMDVQSPPAVIEALQSRVAHGVFGYGIPPQGLNDAVVDYVQKMYHWTIEPEWIVWVPGLVPALHAVTRAFSEADEAVIVPSPVYPPFLEAPRISKRKTITVPFLDTPDGWKLDVDGIEQAAKSGAKLLLLCNPHNPLGCVIPAESLQEISRISEEYGVTICSDEVHSDLILDSVQHCPYASLNEHALGHSITLMAASKTFNIAGLGCAYAIVPEPKLRTKLVNVMKGISGEVNPLGFVATQAALQHGEPWRQDLLNHLRKNRDILEAHISDSSFPVSMHHVEATYLGWLNLENLLSNRTGATLRKAGLWLSDSEPFGAERFLRINFGCPTKYLEQGLELFSSWVASKE